MSELDLISTLQNVFGSSDSVTRTDSDAGWKVREETDNYYLFIFYHKNTDNHNHTCYYNLTTIFNEKLQIVCWLSSSCCCALLSKASHINIQTGENPPLRRVAIGSKDLDRKHDVCRKSRIIINGAVFAFCSPRPLI